MKKKTLLLTLLALAIVTSLTAGTLAVYNKTLNIDAGSVTIKKFAFTAKGGSSDINEPITLAPTQAKKYTFTVSNYTEDKSGSKAVSEVDLKYTGFIDFVGAAALMPGLDAIELVHVGNNEGAVALTPTGTKGQYTFVGKSSQATEAQLDTYVLTMKWVETDNDEETKVALKEDLVAGSLKISVTATQII